MWWDDVLGYCCWSGIIDAIFITPWGWLLLGFLLLGLGIFVVVVEKETEIGLLVSAAGVIAIVLSWRSLRKWR